MPALPMVITEAITNGTCHSLTLSRKQDGDSTALDRISIRPVSLEGMQSFQLTARKGNQEIHENLAARETLMRLTEVFGTTFQQCDLNTRDANYTVTSQPNGKVVVSKSSPTQKPLSTKHDRGKKYLIPDNVVCPFLVELGVMTSAGKVHAAKYHKFRQINRFLEFVNDVVPALPSEDVINVVDFGSGKSALTFAVHHLLTAVRGRDVHIVGLDRKREVIDNCKKIAERLPLEGLQFQVGDIVDYDPGGAVHLAISLHACDTATDDALAKALEWEVAVILAVPCCQHELANKINSAALSPLLKHGIVKNRMAAFATETLRAQVLELCGYKTQVMEFVDLEHTAQNLLIRGVRRQARIPKMEQRIAEYQQFKTLLGIESFHLESALGDAWAHKLKAP